MTGEGRAAPRPEPDEGPRPEPGEGLRPELDEGPRLRLFVAVELADAWKAAFADHQARLRRRLQDEAPHLRLRYVRPEGIHLTLKFLGETPASRLPSIESALGQAVPHPPDLRLAVGRVGSFSDRRGPGVVWAGVAADAEALRRLRLLVERLETWLASAGFSRDRQGGFTPHLTLARLPDGMSQRDREVVVRASSEISLSRLEPMTIAFVSLMQSRLGPGGARYERLGRFPAGPSGE